jgi:hypothetical protein
MRLLLLCLALLAVGCASRSSNRWTGQKPAGEFTVLIAPVAVPQLAAVWPDAGQQFAFDLANRIDILGKDANAWALETLPVSGDPAWNSHVAAADGANWIVQTKILDLQLGPSPLGPQWVAHAEMRAVDAKGTVVFLKSAHGTAQNVDMAKLMAPDSRPDSLAAWGACTNAVSALIEALRVRQEIPAAVVAQPAPAPAPVEPVVPVAITVTSVPDHADVLVDGKFRGTTPLALTLSTAAVKLRIERQGFQPWERELVPSADLQISPALTPLPQAAPAEPQPAPAKADQP